MVVGIDGPAGSGKGTVASMVSKKCNLVYIDTGATYRCVALKVLRNNIDINDTNSIIKIASNIDIKFTSEGITYLDGLDVSKDIRSKEVTKIVSPISSIVEVRKYMVDLQRKMANNSNVIMEGRDITTVVFPNADIKIYLDASIEERAKRRYNENQIKGIDMSYEETKDNMEKRDYNDMHKEVGSLTRTDEQIYIDTTNMTIDEVVNKIVDIIGGKR